MFREGSDGRFEVDVAALRASGARPGWFGLGFIQLKLDDERRLHFWHPDLPQDTAEEELHDHRYEFTSRVVRGSMLHEAWTLDEDPSGSHEVVNVSCEPGVHAEPAPIAVGTPRITGSYELAEGSVYTFPPTEFHRIVARRAVTLLTRGPKVRELARVVRVRGEASVCPFSVEIPEERLWDCISELLGAHHSPGYHLRPIAKGELGEPSKILEEAQELVEAAEQGVAVMELVELSDMVGAIKAYLRRRHPSISLADLERMADVTERAFRNGRR